MRTLLVIPSTRKQGGFTLIEMMIAIAIGLFMTAIIGSLYLNMRGSFRYQEEFARLQENGRFAMEALSRDIRMAGYSSCGSVTQFANVVTGGGANPYLNFTSPVIGYEGGVSTFPAALVTAGVVANTDAIILLGVDSSSELVVKNHNPSAAQIDTNRHSIKAGELLLITDCSHSALFQMTGPSSANPTNVVHNTGTGSPGNCQKELGSSCGASPKLSYTFDPGSSLMRVYSNAYFIAPSSAGNGNSLWVMSMTGQTTGVSAAKELIEGVENMQITYGLDISPIDKVAERFAKANSVTNWSNVVSVRLSIVVSSTKNNLTAAPQTYEFEGTSITATDRKLRKVFTASIAVRNRVP